MFENIGFIKSSFWAVFVYSIIAFAIPIIFKDVFSYNAYHVPEPVYQILAGEDLNRVMPWESSLIKKEGLKNNQGQDSVNATKIIIWNAGKRAIETNEIVQDFEILSPRGVEIIGYEILRKTQSIDEKFYLSQVGENCLSINWTQLGAQQGFTALILTKGVSPNKFEFKGKLTNSKFQRVTLAPDFDPWVHFYYCFACLFFVFVSYIGIKKELKGNMPEPLRLIFFGSAILAIVVYIPNFYNFYYQGYFAPRELLT